MPCGSHGSKSKKKAKKKMKKAEMLAPYMKQAAGAKELLRTVGDWLAGIGGAAAPLAEAGLKGVGIKQLGGRIGGAAKRHAAGPSAGPIARLTEGAAGPRPAVINKIVERDRALMRNLGLGTLGAGGLGLYGGYKGIRGLLGGEGGPPVEKTSAVKRAEPMLDAVKHYLRLLGKKMVDPVEDAAKYIEVGEEPLSKALGTAKQRNVALFAENPNQQQAVHRRLKKRLLALGGAGAAGLGVGVPAAGYAGYKALSGGGDEEEPKEASVKRAAGGLGPITNLERILGAVGGTGGGALIGAGGGALGAESGERGSGALRGALLGALLGGSAGAFTPNITRKLYGKHVDALEAAMNDPRAMEAAVEKMKSETFLPALGLAGVGTAVPAAGGYLAGRTARKGEDEDKEAAVGTPFTDGILQFCLNHQLSGEQVADVLEKGAQVEGPVGEECRQLIDRMIA